MGQLYYHVQGLDNTQYAPTSKKNSRVIKAASEQVTPSGNTTYSTRPWSNIYRRSSRAVHTDDETRCYECAAI